MLPDFFAGKFYFPNEVLYEGNITILTETDYEVGKIDNCCIYDISSETIENADNIEQVMKFTIEVFCDNKNSQDIWAIPQKLNAVKKLKISKSLIIDQTAVTSDNYFVIQHITNIAFYTQPTKDRSFNLTITADIEGVILREPHQDFWVCSHLDLVPPPENEVQDWKQLLNGISIKDTVSIFENFLQLVKGVCNNESSDLIKEDKKKLEKENMKLTNEIYDLRNSIHHLKSEINNQSYIINGLLKIIKPL